MSDVDEIVASIEILRARLDRVVVGVFGFAGSGKSVLAHRLVASAGDAVRVGGDDFLDPVRSHRRSPDWDGVDRHRLRADVLEPFHAGRSVTARPLDWSTGELGQPTPLPRASVLVVDAVGLPHPDVAGCFDLTVWVDVTLDAARQRGMARDRAAGLDHDDLWTDVWSPNDHDFEQTFEPRMSVEHLYRPDDVPPP